MKFSDIFNLKWLSCASFACFFSPWGGQQVQDRYRALRRNIFWLMVFVTVIPLVVMAWINHMQYRKALREEVRAPLVVLMNKTRHSFELFFKERLAAVEFIASAYTHEQLTDEATLRRISIVAKEKFEGFVDLGLVEDTGVQVSYAGPYSLKGKDYSQQEWYHEVSLRGVTISNVFMGYRGFPHVVIAVERYTADNTPYFLRASIDTSKFDELLASMGLPTNSDAFLISSKSVLQTNSKFYGQVLDKAELPLHTHATASYQPQVMETTDANGKAVLLGYVHFLNPHYILVVTRAQSSLLKSWYTLNREIFFAFLIGVVMVFAVVYRLTGMLVDRIRESDSKREAVLREVEHSHKLSSIGRLAAGVAHEINNPLAVINEKAGLMQDILQQMEEFERKETFLRLTKGVLDSVNRCRTITHRLLGFAKRMEIRVEDLSVNDVVRDVLSFLSKEAAYRNIEIRLQLDETLPSIASDRGQLQQVFLNIVNNAVEAVQEGGTILVSSYLHDEKRVGVSITDDGCGIPQESLGKIFEPFFTAKGDKGTGLGLSITYGIIKKLGGSIEVQSDVGQGTCFTVLLPLPATRNENE